jgi:hypothetical protein
MRHEKQQRLKFECEMQDYGTQKWEEGTGFLKCSIRTNTQVDMQYHIQHNHTAEGLGKKLHSETQLANFLQKKGLDFDRDWTNRISFRYCTSIQPSTNSARPDFFLPSISAKLNAVVLLGNDEFAHRQYPCDLRRVLDIANALDKTPEFAGVSLLYIRFNPHYFRKGSKYLDPPLNESHETLFKFIQSLTEKDIKQKGVNLIYMNYDQTPEGNLQMFENQDNENDYVKIYKSCVVQLI